MTAQPVHKNAIQDTNQDRQTDRSFRVWSKALNRVVYSPNLAALHFDELRALYHEIYCDRQSMFKSVEDFNEMLANADPDDEDTRQYVDRKLHQLSKKLSVYSSFYKLIKREANWRVSINKVARARIAIQAKQVGLTEAQINALLDPESSIHRIVNVAEWPGSPAKRKALMVADRLQSMRNEMFVAEFCRILSGEFDEPELTEIREEANAAVEKAVDWQQIEAILIEHMPNDNGVL